MHMSLLHKKIQDNQTKMTQILRCMNTMYVYPNQQSSSAWKKINTEMEQNAFDEPKKNKIHNN